MLFHESEPPMFVGSALCIIDSIVVDALAIWDDIYLLLWGGMVTVFRQLCCCVFG